MSSGTISSVFFAEDGSVGRASLRALYPMRATFLAQFHKSFVPSHITPASQFFADPFAALLARIDAFELRDANDLARWHHKVVGWRCCNRPGFRSALYLGSANATTFGLGVRRNSSLRVVAPTSSAAVHSDRASAISETDRPRTFKR
jgi:hypothetical protein